MNYVEQGLSVITQRPSVKTGQSSSDLWLIMGGFVVVALLFDANRKKGLFDPRGPRLF